MAALAPNHGTVLAGVLDARADALEGGLADAADVVGAVPRPRRDAVVAPEADLEGDGGWWLLAFAFFAAAAVVAVRRHRGRR